MSKYTDSQSLAKILGVSRDTVLEWARYGRIPCLRIGPRVIRFDLDAVEAALELRQRKIELARSVVDAAGGQGRVLTPRECALVDAIIAEVQPSATPVRDNAFAQLAAVEQMAAVE